VCFQKENGNHGSMASWLIKIGFRSLNEGKKFFKLISHTNSDILYVGYSESPGGYGNYCNSFEDAIELMGFATSDFWDSDCDSSDDESSDDASDSSDDESNDESPNPKRKKIDPELKDATEGEDGYVQNDEPISKRAFKKYCKHLDKNK
jgi:hypothetical protein